MPNEIEKVHKSTQDKPLNKKQEDAALHVADDKLPDEKIAELAGISRSCLVKWKKLPEFIAAVEAHKIAWRERVMQSGIADKVNRIAAKNRRWDKLNAVIDARADRYSAEIDAEKSGLNALAGDEDEDGKKDAPRRIPPEEARTGVVIETVVYTKEGPRVEWATDKALLSEIRALEEETAVELGQRITKTEQTVRGIVGVANIDLSKLPMGRLNDLEALLLEAKRDDADDASE